jgi:hypothetical protein
MAGILRTEEPAVAVQAERMAIGAHRFAEIECRFRAGDHHFIRSFSSAVNESRIGFAAFTAS